MTNINVYRTTVTPRLNRMDPPREAPTRRASMDEVIAEAAACNRLGTWRQQNWHTTANDRPAKPPAKGRVLKDWVARYAAVMDALPGTVAEIAKRTGLTQSMTRKALHRLQNNGHVASRKAHHNVFVWEESQ